MKQTVSNVLFFVLLGALVLAPPTAALAQGTASTPAASATPASGFRADFLADWDDMAKKAVRDRKSVV